MTGLRASDDAGVMAEDASADSSSDGRSLCHGLLHPDGWSLFLGEHPTAEADSVHSVL